MCVCACVLKPSSKSALYSDEYLINWCTECMSTDIAASLKFPFCLHSKEFLHYSGPETVLHPEQQTLCDIFTTRKHCRGTHHASCWLHWLHATKFPLTDTCCLQQHITHYLISQLQVPISFLHACCLTFYK